MSTSSDLLALIQLLRTSEFTLALVGAGLSASSGIPTFRGEGSSWRGRDIKSLATRSAFAQDPLLVWQFYEDRRRRAIDADPNGGHRALAKLADMKENFLAITQNVDGLSERAGHDSVKLAPIHGSLLIAKCFDSTCTFQMCNSDTLPLTPTLRLPDTKSSDPNIPLPTASIHELPHCPQCRKSLLRPGVVWFGEPLPLDLIDRVDDWLDDLPRVDLMLVIGTSTRVFPAAEYISRSREKGARVAHFNLEADEHFMSPEDWFIKGDVASTLADIIDSAFEPERHHPGA